MPAALRVPPFSDYNPTGGVVDCPAPVCTVCHDHLALMCAGCFTVAEQGLRAQEVFRCSLCVRLDLVIKGNLKPRTSFTAYECGTCGQGTFYTNSVSIRSKSGRGSCAACHLGRACPRCDQYCLKSEPARCGQCQKKVPAVSSLALWCAGCFSPEELQLQLCRTCHPSTRDLLDKALPSYEDHCAQNFELLSNMTPITGDEPALRLSPLHGGSWMTSASDGHHVGLTRCLDKHGPVTDAPKTKIKIDTFSKFGFVHRRSVFEPPEPDRKSVV